MVNINETNIITVSGAGIGEATCEFKSFRDLRPVIQELNQSPKVAAAGENRIGKQFDRLLEAFGAGCVRVSRRDKPLLALKDGEEVDLMSVDGWQKKLPPQIRTAATQFLNGVALEAEVEATHVLGERTCVRVDTGVGAVHFLYPPMDDEKFQKELKHLMVDQNRVRGANIENCSYEVRMRFFKRTCIEVADMAGSDSEDWKSDVPENWIIASCRALERAESLGEEDLGN